MTTKSSFWSSFPSCTSQSINFTTVADLGEGSEVEELCIPITYPALSTRAWYFDFEIIKCVQTKNKGKKKQYGPCSRPSLPANLIDCLKVF